MYISIGFSGTKPYVVYSDSTFDYCATAMTLNDSNVWESASGNAPISDGEINYTSMVTDSQGGIYVTYAEKNSKVGYWITVKKFDKGIWSLYGGYAASSTYVGQPTIAIDHQDHI